MERRKFIMNVASLGAFSLIRPIDLFGNPAASSDNYMVKQFENKGLAHFSYAVMAGNKIILIDPQRDPQIYYDYAAKNKANIVGVIETHPHADFVSGHLEIHKLLNVPIYSSSLTKATYPSTPVDDGQHIRLTDKIGLRVLFTPGHAPDHIALVLYENGKDLAVFSGDSLLIGDVGRPDLRDFSNDVEAQRQRLAEMMYDTVHGKFAKLADDVIVYPAHGAGSLCGKSIRKAAISTIGYEKQHNHAFVKRSKAEFVSLLLNDQPFVPKYFQYNVGMNLKGAPEFNSSVSKLKYLPRNYQPEANALMIDSRPAAAFKASYLTNAINIQDGSSFETWLGTIVSPESEFYLIGASEDSLQSLVRKAASIGYESRIKAAFVYDSLDGEKFTVFDNSTFKPEANMFTYLDVRMSKEVKEARVFKSSINIPLQELTERISEIPAGKPILVNCASGYRSAVASSIIKKYLPTAEVFDLGAAVSEYKDSGGKGD